jgi:hypothetical protein
MAVGVARTLEEAPRLNRLKQDAIGQRPVSCLTGVDCSGNAVLLRGRVLEFWFGVVKVCMTRSSFPRSIV